MKYLSIIEVSIVFLIVQLISWVLKPIEFFKLEIELLGWSYTSGLISISITFIILLILKKDFKLYGFKKEGWKFSLDVGLTSWLVLLIPVCALIFLHLSYSDLFGALILSVCEIVALVLILLLIRKKKEEDYEKKSSNARINVLLLLVLLLIPIFLSFYFNKPTDIIGKVISTVIWQFIFSGFGEEIRYRGYYQPRINEEFGRPFKFIGVEFGLGLIVASLLFGLSHVLNPFSPFEGIFELNWSWGIWTFFSGLFYGFLKEKTNNIIAPGIAHGSDALGEALAIIFS